MPDIRIQRFEVTVPPGDSQTDIIVGSVRPANTRIVKASPANQMQILSAGFPTVQTRDMLVGLELLDSTTVRIHTSPNKGFSGIVSFSLMEYTGDVGGPNEFTVTRKAIHNPIGSNGIDLTAHGFNFGDPLKATTHIVGVVLDNVVNPDTIGDFYSSSVFYPMRRLIAATSPLEFHQIWVGTSDHAMRVYIEQVEWIGSNWTIAHPPFGLGTANRSDTVPFTVAGGSVGKEYALALSVDWSNTWIEQVRGIDLFTTPALGEVVSHIYPGLPSGTAIFAFAPGGSDTTNAPTNAASFYAISNPDVKVSHQGVRLGTGDAQLQIVNSFGPKTLRIPVRNATAEINAGPDRVVSILAGSPDGLGPSTDASLQFDDDGAMTWRRTFPAAAWDEYIQTIQFGPRSGTDGNIEDLVIRKPEFVVSIKNR